MSSGSSHTIVTPSECLADHGDLITSMHMSEDRSMVVMGCRDTTIRLWSIHPQCMCMGKCEGHKLQSLHSQRKTSHYSASEDGAIFKWDQINCFILESLVGHTAAVNKLVSCSYFLRSASSDKAVR